MEQVPPNGVFWMHNGGVLMSQTIGQPAILDGVRQVTEDGQVLEDAAVGPDGDAVGGGDVSGGVSSPGNGANEEGGVQDTTPSEPEPSS
jgi:hypothetical protein